VQSYRPCAAAHQLDDFLKRPRRRSAHGVVTGRFGDPGDTGP
jgi:hypothetical protein